jgi:DNA polymerase I-like protein with 3'-5' exonuclease and polymerase domains
MPMSTPTTSSSSISLEALSQQPSPPQVCLLLTVHDEVVLEVPEAQVEGVAAAVKSIMEGVVPPGGWPRGQGVPLKVEVKAGTDWLQCG